MNELFEWISKVSIVADLDEKTHQQQTTGNLGSSLPTKKIKLKDLYLTEPCNVNTNL